jgi:hypothetical protein
MDEDRFPNAELKFVHKIQKEHEVQTEAKLRQFARKCVLKKGSASQEMRRGQSHTAVGTRESACRRFSIAWPSTDPNQNLTPEKPTPEVITVAFPTRIYKHWPLISVYNSFVGSDIDSASAVLIIGPGIESV